MQPNLQALLALRDRITQRVPSPEGLTKWSYTPDSDSLRVDYLGVTYLCYLTGEVAEVGDGFERSNWRAEAFKNVINKEPNPTMTQLETTILDRDSKYGGFANVSIASCELRTVFHRAAGVTNTLVRENSYRLEPFQIEALNMILHKLARIACGDPNYVDNWHDIAGYATLVERELIKAQNEEDPNYQLAS